MYQTVSIPLFKPLKSIIEYIYSLYFEVEQLPNY